MAKAYTCDRDLDFIVIGAQKGGTTSLWQYLRRHPQIAMPDYKEAAIFCADDERVSQLLASFMRSSFGDAAPGTKLGKVATHYMMGQKTADVDCVAERIACTFPDVRLIALLRDPIERAMSHYRMLVRQGVEDRSFEALVEELLEPDRLEIARSRPNRRNSYLAQGEYGRILRSYRARFPFEQIQIESTDELSRQPGLVLDRVLSFLGLPSGYRPEGFGVHHHVGGSRPRLDAAGEAQLRAFMEEHVWPGLAEGAEHLRLAFDFFLVTWNVLPDSRQPSLSETNRMRLEEHYRADAELLVELCIDAPWLDGWDQ